MITKKIDPWFEENLVCPIDKSKLTINNNNFVCSTHQHKYEIYNNSNIRNWLCRTNDLGR